MHSRMIRAADPTLPIAHTHTCVRAKSEAVKKEGEKINKDNHIAGGAAICIRASDDRL